MSLSHLFSPTRTKSFLKSRQFLQKFFQVFLSVLCCVLVVTLQGTPSIAQSSITLATVAEIVDGSQVYIQRQQAKVNDQAKTGQRVRTGQARAQLTFNNGAIARLAPNSSLTVGQKCARLQRGTLLINGAVNGCTASVVTGVRGTTYLIEVDEQNQTQVKVLEGEVAVDPANLGNTDPEAPDDLIPGLPSLLKQTKPTHPAVAPSVDPAARPFSVKPSIVLKSGQKATVQPGREPIVAQLSQQEFEALLRGALFTGFNVQIPGIDKVQSSFSRLFPGVPFPIDIPGVSVPGVPGIPGIPGLPF
ncbi:MAG: FecR family protein [Leptolyngbyaceae cyanobacterium bins.59]|nr:FecR family protein [Leptolyngbyaceae cyanobacterium bins.59]